MDLPQSAVDATHEDRPNVVLIAPHDFGRELGCYGRQAHTPTLDAVADDGVLFENHFCTSPSCAPSRASLTTGLQPHNHGMIGHPISGNEPSEESTLTAKGWEIHEGIRTLPMYLNERGYTTHLAGGVHSNKATLGHERHHQLPDTEGMGGARATADIVTDLLSEEADTDAPFFLEVTTANAHHSFSNREGGFKDDPLPGYEGPSPEDVDLSPYFDDEIDATEGYDETAVRQHFADFYEDLYELDHAVGQILETLEETGQREDTVFVFTADHGIPFQMAPKAKGWNYDLGVESALLIQYPGRIEGGQRYDTLASNVDILPTILDLVDGRPPADVDGRSFRPLADDTDDRRYEEREAVFFETTYKGRYDPIRGIRTQDYKLLRNFWPNGYRHSERERATEVELYDLRDDPSETDNLAEVPAYADVREALYDRLRERLDRDDDPIVDGPVPPQRGVFDSTI